jgi:Tol biopolymer transport system component
MYRIRPDGTGLQQITNTDLRDELHPRFAPNGRRFVYATFSSTGAKCSSVVIAASDGTNPRRVRVGCNADRATWSPRGRRLLVEKFDQQTEGTIWSMALDGSHRHFLTQGIDASWRPNKG